MFAFSAHAHGNFKFVNGQWFDGTRFVKKTMYSVDNVFRSTFEVDGETRTIDLGGRYVVPPFADAHNHVFADGANVEQQLARYLRAGIFYVKNPNSSITGTMHIRAQLNKPETVDVLYSIGGLTSTGGHPKQIYDRYPDMADNAYFEIDSLEEFERKWPKIEAGKPDFIKLYLDGSRGLEPRLFAQLVERVHRKGLTATVHVTSAVDFHLAVAAGADEITHLPLEPIDPADAELAAQKHITVVTTTLSHRPTPGTPPHRENLALLKRAGVNVLLGVDSDRTVIDEVENVRAFGVYSDLELLRMLTASLFPKRKIGKLEDGYEASFLALDANPLEDFGAIRRIANRVKQGHVLEVAPEKRTVEQNLNQLGYTLLNQGKTDEAIAIFALNAKEFPKSSNVWDSLAEAYVHAGQKEKAIEHYKKSLELNPHNKNAADMLQKLASHP
ncbi:MAG TPA: tetratricopeptide repeat protein [Thermoanaerobaculia bacterium]|nr:tetratricopeptide repeat protein [Thermoanaerobaculia bacterium]